MNRLILLSILLLLGCGSTPTIYSTKEALVSDIISFHNSKDIDNYLKTIHPKCRERMTSENMVFFREMFRKEFSNSIPKNAEIEYSTDSSNINLPFSDKFDYPILPTASVTINFNKTEYSSVSKMMWLTNDSLGWHQIYGIPHPATVKQFKAMQIKKKEFQHNIEVHISQMNRKLYNQIISILEKDKSLSKAYKLHMEQTKTDKTFSVMVIKEIRKKEHLEW